MTALLPKTWLPDFSRLLPDDPVNYVGAKISLWFTALYLVVITVRSGIHVFAPDGGAQSIATVNIDVAGGSNIVAVFGQWGAIQFLLALLLWVLILRYRGLLPLVIVTLLLEPVLRAVAGHLKPIETVGTAPGAALNVYSLPILGVILYLALCPARE